MRIEDLLSELKETQIYKEFHNKNHSAFFSAGFFVIDLESKTEKIQLDFFLPEKEKIIAFEYPFKKSKIHEDKIKSMKEQSSKLKINIDDLEKISKEIIKDNNSQIVPTKIIAIIKENQWNLTCMDNHLGIVRIKLDALTGDVVSFDKGSLMDFMGMKK